MHFLWIFKIRDTPYLAEGLTVNNASESKYFDKGKPTKVLIHDFMQSTENPLIYDLKDGKLSILHKNILIVIIKI